MTRRSRRSQLGEPELSFRQELEVFRQLPSVEQLKAIGALLLLLPVLAVVFFVGFFLFGGWALFDDHLPAWVERLFTFMLIVLIAWSFLKPVFDRWELSSRE